MTVNWLLFSVVYPQMRFNLRKNFPVLTTKACVSFLLSFFFFNYYFKKKLIFFVQPNGSVVCISFFLSASLIEVMSFWS
jgi:hypothetical protein